MGSGVFQVDSWEKGQQIVMTPNPHYAEAPAFKSVEIRIIKEASARRLQLENGDLDIAENLPIDQISTLKQAEGVVVGEWPSFSVTYLYLNNERGPLADEKVREAVSYAIDYDGIIQGILLGNATQMRGPIPQGMWGHDEELMQYSYDAERARASRKPGWLAKPSAYLYASNDPNWEPIGLTLQANLAQIGERRNGAVRLRHHA